jgi:predicted methyltransferase
VTFLKISAVTLLVTLAACSKEPAQEQAAALPPPAAAESATVDPLVSAINGEHRSDKDKARDKYRHPAESLAFWGLKPGMAILELQPGDGWWTHILAPYARATGGQYHATAADLNDPKVTDAAKKSRSDFDARFNGKPDVYGTVQLVNYGPSAALPANTFDFVLTARSIHGWVGGGRAEAVFKELYSTLKPGGVLAVEQHRAKPGKQDPKAASGYVTEEHVIQLAQAAGLELVGRSEINANPADTTDHPFGVWTLPPTARTRPYSEGPDANDPKFDRTKYDAIGESDRMTLTFRKPASATAS